MTQTTLLNPVPWVELVNVHAKATVHWLLLGPHARDVNVK